MKTVSSMTSFFLALALFPQVQRRAQAELDVVVGRDRLPTFNDRPRLPYIEALCKELLRWQMVTPIGTIWNLLYCHDSEIGTGVIWRDKRSDGGLLHARP